ncbi:MAG: type II toxin-antitoxin system VapC family toxin [Actinomycetota bacterium]
MLVDTGILVAAANAFDPDCEPAIGLLQLKNKFVTDAILSEAHHLIAARVNWQKAALFLESIDHDLLVESSLRSDRDRAKELCKRYLDAKLDYIDALSIAIAERLNEHVVATFDARHFRLVRPNHVDAFEIIP